MTIYFTMNRYGDLKHHQQSLDIDIQVLHHLPCYIMGSMLINAHVL